MEAPAFPLPAGHVFGPTCGDLSVHDGRQVFDSQHLRQWQNAYCGRWRRPQATPTGLFDGPTQRGVAEVQTVLGLPVTGRLGADEWAAVWEREPPTKPEPPPKPEPTPTERYYAKLRRQKILDRWKRYSKYKVVYGATEGAPDWYPGRPFGPHETGPHVTRLRELLGFSSKGKYTLDMARRVRGLQRAHGLPESGLCDGRLAALLDPPQQDDPPPS